MTACSGNPSEPRTPFRRLVVFGDSNVDSGNLYRLVGAPQRPRWRGRETNGPVVSEYLAEELGLELCNHAVIGAFSGRENVTNFLFPEKIAANNTGLLDQVEQAVRTSPPFTDADLLFVWAGSNDLWGVPPTETARVQERIDSVVGNLRSATAGLISHGARHLIVANRTPRNEMGTQDDDNGLALNAAVGAMLADMQGKARIVAYDAYAAVADMMRRPQAYGFSEVARTCMQVEACFSEDYDAGLHVANRFISWDTGHKTTRVHEIMAGQIAEMIRELASAKA